MINEMIIKTIQFKFLTLHFFIKTKSSLHILLSLFFLSAYLSCLRTRMVWCCPWGWSLRESLLAPGPSDWTSWKEATCWCLWTHAACWPLSTWGCARTREKPTHAHTFTNASPLFESTSSLRGWFLFLFPWYGLFFWVLSLTRCSVLFSPIILVSPIK